MKLFEKKKNQHCKRKRKIVYFSVKFICVVLDRCEGNNFRIHLKLSLLKLSFTSILSKRVARFSILSRTSRQRIKRGQVSIFEKGIGSILGALDLAPSELITSIFITSSSIRSFLVDSS